MGDREADAKRYGALDEDAGTRAPNWARGKMATDLIEELQAIVDAHGDLPVCMWDDSKVREAVAYDKDGNNTGPLVEIVLHGF